MGLFSFFICWLKSNYYNMFVEKSQYGFIENVYQIVIENVYQLVNKNCYQIIIENDFLVLRGFRFSDRLAYQKVFDEP